MRKIILALAAATLCVGCAKNTPEQAVEGLYGAMLQDKMIYSLGDAEVEKLKPRLSKTLVSAFDNAIAYTHEQEKQDCGKPDFGDGYGLRSYSSDAFSAFTVGAAKITGDTASVEVDFTVPDGRPGQKDIHLKDVVQLVREDRQWKIDDVLLGGEASSSVKAELLSAKLADITLPVCPAATDLPVPIAQWLEGQLQALRKQHGNPDIAENPEARKLACGNLLDDQKPNEMALLFTVEGVPAGNNWQQHLALFSLADGKTPGFVISQQVGGKGQFAVEEMVIVCEDIKLGGKRHAKGDADCCPSEPATESWTMMGDGKLSRSSSTGPDL